MLLVTNNYQKEPSTPTVSVILSKTCNPAIGLCSIEEDVQYFGGMSPVHWRVFSTGRGCHPYIGVFRTEGEGVPSVYWRVFSAVEGYHQYRWGYLQ